MSSDIVPAGGSPEEPDHSKPDSSREGRPHKSDGDGIPTRKDCLRAIAALSGLTVIDKVSPAKANSIRANYVAILHEHARAQQDPAATIRDEDLERILQNHRDDIDLF